MGELLKGKIALVTGAAGAIGYGICQVLLENGATIVATDLPGEKLDAFAEDLDKLAQGQSMGLPMDVTKVDSVATALDETLSKYGQLDILVHNAGIAHVSKIIDMDIEKFQFLEKVNVLGTLIVLKETGRRMIEKNAGGDIVIMSTKNVPSPSAGFGAYSATKAACHQLGRIASLEFAPHDIRVNMIAPDAVFSEGKYKSGLWDLVGQDRMRARGMNEEELHQYYRERNLLKAAVTGRHVANAVLFLVSRQSPTTGATIPVDGGLPDATPR
ncbi:MAG: SDR family oxidoreductase [Anaerohalosphaeraceae bacterium]|jgi:NAD(P)-dependent dehydrogenase (short-subunit alcohol dehydrogenase family)